MGIKEGRKERWYRQKNSEEEERRKIGIKLGIEGKQKENKERRKIGIKLEIEGNK